MSYSKVQIANLALAKVGSEAAQITSLTQDSKEANLCNKFYEPAKREVLRMHTWNCAKKRSELAKLTSTPDSGWKYEYALPADCVRPLELHASSSSDRTYIENIEWAVEGRKIRTNADGVWLLYIKNTDDPSEMDDLFIKAFYTNLAVKLAYPLTEDRQLTGFLMEELESVILPEARRINGTEGLEFPSVDSEWLEASYGSGFGCPFRKFSQSSY